MAFATEARRGGTRFPTSCCRGSGQYPMPAGLVQMLSSTPTFNPVVSPGAAIQLPQLALATIISISPVLVIFLLAQRFLVTGLTAGATKG